MNNGAFIRALAGSPDVPVVVKDGDTYYQTQQVQEMDGAVIIMTGAAIQLSTLRNANVGSGNTEPVGVPDEAPEDTTSVAEPDA